MDDVIDILCATNKDFIMPVGVLLTSLLENNKDVNVRAHVFYDFMTDDDKRRLTSLETQYRNCKIELVKIDIARYVPKYKLKAIEESCGRYSLSTLYRLLAPDVLSEIDKILYLDADMIVTGMIKDIFDIELGSRLLGVVPAGGWCVDNNYPEWLKRSPETPYFNAGVLLMNLALMRELKFGEKVMDLFIANHDSYKFLDQDALNIAADGNLVILSPKYNLVREYLKYDFFDKMPEYVKEEIRQIVRNKDQRIVHLNNTYIFPSDYEFTTNTIA